MVNKKTDKYKNKKKSKSKILYKTSCKNNEYVVDSFNNRSIQFKYI